MTLQKMTLDTRVVQGDKFLKWTDHDTTSATAVTLHVDAHGFFLYWKHKETHCLDICQIRDVRTGTTARIPKEGKLREMVSVGPGLLEEKTLTIVYGQDFVTTNFVNFCTHQKEIAEYWYSTLIAIITNVHNANLSSFQALQKIHTQIVLQSNVNSRISLKVIYKMFASNKETKKSVENALQKSSLPFLKDSEIDVDNFNFDVFFTFYKNLIHRREVEEIYNSFCPNREAMNTSDFLRFINSQRDSRLNEILYPYCTKSKASTLLSTYESNPDNIQNGILSQESFLRYLLSDDNQIVGPERLDYFCSMNEPLSHYFIQSSHNTYLTGHQWTGKSSVEMYRQVLLSGCRCIELDLWDGKTKEEEPVILHGYTLVPEILAKDVFIAIAESAFKTSEYPLILSFENHCKAKQQAKIASYCRLYFGSLLLSDPLESHPLVRGEKLPSPNDLKFKIIIKNKKKHNRESSNLSFTENRNEDKGGEESGDSESDEDEIPSPNPIGKESKAAEEISVLVNYVQAVHFHGFQNAERRDRSYEMSSFEESSALGYLKEQPIEFVNYNKKQLSRIFPRGTRVDSSNFMPQVFWNAGCQFVALNYQTLDVAMQLNLGIFEYNGRCGYLPKPFFMCREDRTFDPFADSTVDGIVPATVSIKILSGQFLTDRHVGTYVEVDMYGLPCDTIRRKFRTKIVTYNGISPRYCDEPFVFKQVVLPDLAILRIGVYEESGKFIGHRVLPVAGLRPGYRHISLRNEFGQFLTFPTLFCHLNVQDFVPDRFSNFADALANPIRYQSEMEKREQQLLILTETDEEKDSSSTNKNSIKFDQSSQSANDILECGNGPKVMATPSRSVKEAISNGLSSRTASVRQKNALRMSAEPLSFFMENKNIVSKQCDLKRKIRSLNKKYDKEFEKLILNLKNQEDKLSKLSKDQGLKYNNNSKNKFVKILSDKTMDISISGGDREAEDKLRKSIQLQSEKKSYLTKEKERQISDLKEKYFTSIVTSLEKLINSSHTSQFKILQSHQEKDITEIMKIIEEEADAKIKDSSPKTNKDDAIKLKTERRSFIIRRGVEERTRLEELYRCKKKDLEEEHEEIRNQFYRDKDKIRSMLRDLEV